MNESNFLSNTTDIILDTGIILNYLTDPDADSTKWLDNNILVEESFFTIHSHQINKIELLYLTCREKGIEEASKLIKSIEEFIYFHDELELNELVWKIKCKYCIALADCFTIATGLFLESPIFFKKEKELTKAVINSLKKDFNVNIVIFES